MAEPIDDAWVARVERWAVSGPSVHLLSDTVLGLLARLDAERARADAEAFRRIACAARVRDANAAEAERDRLRAALKQLLGAWECVNEMLPLIHPADSLGWKQALDNARAALGGS